VTVGRPRLLAAGLGVVLIGIVVWQVGHASGVSVPTLQAATHERITDIAAGTGTGTETPWTATLLDSVGDPTATPVRTPSVALATRTPLPPAPRTAAPTQTDRPWQQDPAFLRDKLEGRVVLDAQGEVVILSSLPGPRDYPSTRSLDTSWTGLIQEPPRVGTDDHGKPYTDWNYSLFCGAGAGTVVLYYWKATRKVVTTTAGTFTEPVNVGTNRYASTYWGSQSAGGYGRGMVMYMAEVEWPTIDQGLSWWKRPGLMNWDARPPSTDVPNLIDAVNWEASGRTRLNYFYVAVPASKLTPQDLLAHVHTDISMGVPVVVAARTSNNQVSLPFWRVKPTKSAVNHFITIVGYDDNAGTYTVIDTCGVSCSDSNTRSGVSTVSQATLYALILAESDDDGIMW
jgi:hypothetical protein